MVVAPVVALMQWKHEIETHAEGFTVCLWHGQGRMKADELKKYDVVGCFLLVESLLRHTGTQLLWDTRSCLSSTAERVQERQCVYQRAIARALFPVAQVSYRFPVSNIADKSRVILDEAHNIKERSTNAAKAAFALNAQYKWCLSGTPLQNRVGELYSLVRFLGADPFSHYFCKQCDCKSLHWQVSWTLQKSECS